ncbi:hypothetical protein [Mucilaginibacter gilvus]|uniref:Uncharacterized protein n=1 Tax=Mucilaginibacter gilvus TaxID=2305909 RepID=A0A3S3X0Z3_9SPHI|nr:hypothetical protein [Mucilaginibacter gilvus]RWY48182.1 hypothetical protein EPL05_21665 [Mucilaginibacter gilvus]
MNIEELILSFLDKKADQEEKRRQIDYDRRNEMSELEKLLPSNSKQFHILNLNDVIQFDEKVYEQLTAELNELGSELRPILMDQNATYISPIEVHIENESYAMIWLDDNGVIQGIRRISKI